MRYAIRWFKCKLKPPKNCCITFRIHRKSLVEVPINSEGHSAHFQLNFCDNWCRGQVAPLLALIWENTEFCENLNVISLFHYIYSITMEMCSFMYKPFEIHQNSPVMGWGGLSKKSNVNISKRMTHPSTHPHTYPPNHTPTHRLRSLDRLQICKQNWFISISSRCIKFILF